MARLGHPCQYPVHQPGHVAKGSSRLHMPEEHDINQNGYGDGDCDETAADCTMYVPAREECSLLMIFFVPFCVGDYWVADLPAGIAFSNLKTKFCFSLLLLLLTKRKFCYSMLLLLLKKIKNPAFHKKKHFVDVSFWLNSEDLHVLKMEAPTCFHVCKPANQQ